MRITSLIDDRSVIKRMLEHFGLWGEGIRVTTGTDPPAFHRIVDPWIDDPFPDYGAEPTTHYANAEANATPPACFFPV